VSQGREGHGADRRARLQVTLPAAIFARSQSNRGSLLEAQRALAKSTNPRPRIPGRGATAAVKTIDPITNLNHDAPALTFSPTDATCWLNHYDERCRSGDLGGQHPGCLWFRRTLRLPCIHPSSMKHAVVRAAGQAISAVSARDAPGFFEHCGFQAVVQSFWLVLEFPTVRYTSREWLVTSLSVNCERA
jgi:hypothetical protein